MELIYLTSKKYPGKTADHFFIKEMADAFGKSLKEKFLLVLAGNSSDLFRGLKTLNAGPAFEKGRTVYYFFWLFFFVIRSGRNRTETVFFSNDPNLLSDLIFLRKIFRFRYRICSEWHMLFNDWRDALIAKNSDYLVTTSKRLKNIIAKRFDIDEGRFFVAYGGVNIGNYEKPVTRQCLGLPADKILVAYVGLFRTMGMEKGIRTMIGSLPHLPEKVNMLFVGGTAGEISGYRNEAEAAGVSSRCIFVEKQNSEKVPQYQLASDILVIPYPDQPHFRDYGFPMKAYEYLASRMPVIYSKLKLLEKVLGDCGYGFKPDDPADLAEKIRAVLAADAGEIKRRADICYAKAERYSWEKRAQGIVNFFKQLNPQVFN